MSSQRRLQALAPGTWRGQGMGQRYFRCGFVLALLAASCPKTIQAQCSIGGANPLPATGQPYVGTLETGCQLFMQLQMGQDCNSSSYLTVEMWDLGANIFNDTNTSAMAADPLLGLAQSAVFSAAYQSPGNWVVVPPDALFDQKGYELMRHYMTVQQQLSAGHADQTWYATLQNLDTWTRGPLHYQIRASCSQQQACPAPDLAPSPGQPPVCSGNGACSTSGTCACRAGWGDVGCNQAVFPLVPAAPEAHTLESNGWLYWEVVLDRNAAALTVQLTRSAGDPVLFLKRIDQGFQPGGVPAVQDFSACADVAAFQDRLDRHHVSLTAPNATSGSYYAAVYNNDAYLRETVQFVIEALVQPWDGPQVCPFNCSGRGSCTGPAACTCAPGYTGEFCDGTLGMLYIDFPQPATGYLLPGQWAYYQLTLDSSDASWMGGLLVDFSNDGGHAVLLMKAGGLPSFIDTEFTFRSQQQIKGEQLFLVKPQSLEPAIYFIGIFNMDFYAHQPYNYKLLVTPPGGLRLTISPYLSIVLGVTLSVVFCLAAGLCRRYAHVHRVPGQVGAPAGHAPATRGIDAAMVASFPSYPYKAYAAPDLEAGAEHAQGKQEEACAVCLAEYEPDEVLRRLPPCGHEFHQACIDLWLTNHTTCPMCRYSMLPPGVAAASPAEGAAIAEGAVLELSPRTSAVPLLAPSSAAEAVRSSGPVPEEHLGAPPSPPSIPPVAAALQPPPGAPLPKASSAIAAAVGIASTKLPSGMVHPGPAALLPKQVLSASMAVDGADKVGGAEEAVPPVCHAGLPESIAGGNEARAGAQGLQAAHAILQQRSRSFDQGRAGLQSARLVISLTADSSSPVHLPQSHLADVGHILPRAPAARSEPCSPQTLHVTAVFDMRPAIRIEEASDAQPQAS